MSMTCEKFVELVTEYLEDAMNADTRERFEEHLALCPGCLIYLDQIRETVSQAGQIRPEDLSPAARDHLLAAFNDWRPKGEGTPSP
ncbi:MAG TPA: zf-HC2 domain-containing protein [Acidimicrobiales bacterium]|nr:zf-HC2 domain-containing protein [Acidimicrobiales bacterium]